MMMMKIYIHTAISASTNWNCSLIRPHRNNTLRPFNFAPSSSLSTDTFSSNRITCSSNSHSIKTYRLSQLTNDEVLGLKTRPRIDFSSIFSMVNPIVHDVQRRGDAAVKEYTSRFDKVELDRLVEVVPELPDPVLDPHIKEAFDVAYGNIYAFHAAQKSPERSVENMKVEKIFGPGNQYVTAAKMILQNSEAMVSIDMPAGPSEVLVIADKHAIPSHVAADLLSQAEHGPDSQVVLVTAGDGVDLNSIQEELSKQCNSLPRGEFASKALSHSFIVHARDMLEVPAATTHRRGVKRRSTKLSRKCRPSP
ncbi:histidinol dehydrogenase, chloroplastic [Arachis ipaensis]|uniref:Uncharacterized protein n=1 Tax=Arachis hypogaea TaxID=3818 RepID=A0A444ZDV3_ARAHY|nr:histidinol dehydrogenase, chloroplastic [Arachis ipaensis]XP_025646281.1 histidinol dehydrogenase, chloroplastic [Arachis hypogaea]QHO06450.1 Histidinol dehydrogenase [Arachis hypogaea]RYR12342.1 hypothetical protein Ahy_B04g069882 isoform E [Arachis hypogaea]